jgi:sugar lactone lactonase YvrE
VNLIIALTLIGSLWETDSLEEFRKGEFKNVSLMSTPELHLAPEMASLAEPKELLVLSLAADSKGSIYAGTGSEGRVYRVSSGKSESLLSIETGQVLALAVDRQDNLYAGTAPEGIIYRVHDLAASSHEREEYFRTGQKYVWALAFGDDGALYAGTGDSGLIYRITNKGQGSVYYDAPEPHITSLAWQNDLYAGSSGNGLVYRIHGKDAQVLYKTARQEIRGLVVDPNGVVYAAANGDPDKALSASSLSDARPLLYRIRPDGNATVLFASPDSMIFALARRGSNLLVGTGSRARLYEINTDTASNDFGTSTIVLESREGQILSLLALDRKSPAVILGTGNPGKVYRLEPSYAKEGAFESRVFDTEAISHWGRCFWTGKTSIGTSISVATRTGNSNEPDDTWGKWEALRGDQISSGPARYIQYQVTLATADNAQTPSLSRLTIAYAQTNLPPVVKTMQVKNEEDGRAQGRSVTWEASDPNSDSLAVSIFIRGENESDWKALQKDKVAITKYTLDTDRLPDGWYQVKLVVSDKPSRPLGSELSGEKISPRLLIDNTPPRVDEISATQSTAGTLPAFASKTGGVPFRLTFLVKDDYSLIQKCDVSVNLKDWQPVAPESGIFDEQTERFSVEVELERGENVVVIRAQDRSGNTGTGKKIVKTP